MIPVEASPHLSRGTELRGGQYFFDCSELLSTRGGCNRPFTMQFIIFQYFAGFFALFSLNPREVCPHLLWREHAPHLGNEPRQLWHNSTTFQRPRNQMPL